MKMHNCDLTCSMTQRECMELLREHGSRYKPSGWAMRVWWAGIARASGLTDKALARLALPAKLEPDADGYVWGDTNYGMTGVRIA